MDLTKITTPFGLLDAETQAALMAHAKQGGETELYLGKTGWIVYTPKWVETCTYRAKPQPPRKTVYPWDALDDSIKWAAVPRYLYVNENETGEIRIFELEGMPLG